ncbi:MAG: serine/threonine protein kinase [Planctomycetia bacterium]|nr:serine/threonine protein kinase [Planctomycetia bacterium]
MPPPDTRVNDLLLRWEELREQGQPQSAVELCRSCPELLPELERRIRALEAFSAALPDTRHSLVVARPLPLAASQELQPLLHSRLRGAGLIFLGGCLCSLALTAFDAQQREGMVWFDWLLFLAALVATGGLVGWLQLRRELPVPVLRRVEVLLIAVAMLSMAWGQIRWLRSGWLLDIAQGTAERKVMLLAGEGLSLYWFALIVLYGTFMPTTWRRCALLVGSMALTPILVTVGMGLTDERLGRYLLHDFLPTMSAWLTMAVAIAVYGSHKISELRRAASQLRKLGQYELKQRLGAGGMGEVYLAEHRLLKRPCAIKLIQPERAGDVRAMQRFEREVQVMATLTHWNTVEIYDFGHAEDGTFYYAMEYLPGWNLDDLVERHGPLSPERAVHILRQACAALREAHAAGLIHRDIKPSNLILCERGGVADVVKLLDFGLVQLAAAPRPTKLTWEGAIVGTPAYMSPEQAAGKELDHRSDIYSLGATAYFLLTGQLPFDRPTAVELLAAHIGQTVPPLTQHRPDLPADLEAVILRCLAKAPADRYPDAAALEAALAACSCAGQWSSQQAGQWWQNQPRSDATLSLVPSPLSGNTSLHEADTLSSSRAD